jgi:hypothetical protein
MGGCGNPAIVPDYRPDFKQAVQSEMIRLGDNSPELPKSLFHIPDAIFYSPLVSEWTPEDGVTEATMLARAHVTVGPILDTTPGQASVMEDFFRFARAVITGQEAFFHIAPGIGQGKEIQVARAVGYELINYLTKYYDAGIHIAASMERMAQDVARQRLAAVQHESPAHSTPVMSAGNRHTPLAQRAVLSGSGTQDWQDS